MLRFDESSASGFFGFGRYYAASARLECGSAEDLVAGWEQAVRETAAWRARRVERAKGLELHLLVPPPFAWEAILFITAQVVVPPSSLAEPLRGLRIDVAVFGVPDMEQFLDLILHPEATSKDRWPAGIHDEL
jgi:hypothetical protein